MMWEALGGLVLVAAALAVSHWAAYRTGRLDGARSYKEEMAGRRLQRRAEARALAAMRGHGLAPFPDEAEFERLASTGELEAMAEAGQVDDLKRHVAMFWRAYQLREWARKKESAA